MAEGKQKQTKAERKQARAGGQTKAERRQAQADGKTKTELKQARAGRKRAARAGIAAVPDAPGEDVAPEERIEWRLARIEEAVATQSQRSEELLAKVDAMLQEASGSDTPEAKPD
jgi:hypothetical protein